MFLNFLITSLSYLKLSCRFFYPPYGSLFLCNWSLQKWIRPAHSLINPSINYFFYETELYSTSWWICNIHIKQFFDEIVRMLNAIHWDGSKLQVYLLVWIKLKLKVLSKTMNIYFESLIHQNSFPLKFIQLTFAVISSGLTKIKQ